MKVSQAYLRVLSYKKSCGRLTYDVETSSLKWKIIILLKTNLLLIGRTFICLHFRIYIYIYTPCLTSADLMHLQREALQK